MCNDIIESGQSKHGLLNQLPFTRKEYALNNFTFIFSLYVFFRLHCKCDQKFYQCLKNCPADSAQIIGDIYFDILGSPCYKKEYPVLKCKTHDR